MASQIDSRVALPALDVVVPADRNVYLDLVAGDHPLGGWSPGFYSVDYSFGNSRVVPNYYGEKYRKDIIAPPGTSGGYKLTHGVCT